MEWSKGGGLVGPPGGGCEGTWEYLNVTSLGCKGGWLCDTSTYGSDMGYNKGSSWYEVSGVSSITYHTMGWRGSDLVIGDREASSICPSDVSPSYEQNLGWGTYIMVGGWGEGSL